MFFRLVRNVIEIPDMYIFPETSFTHQTNLIKTIVCLFEWMPSRGGKVGILLLEILPYAQAQRAEDDLNQG